VPVRAALALAEQAVIAMAGQPELEPYGTFEQEFVRLGRREARRFRARIDQLVADLRHAHSESGELDVLLTVGLVPRAAPADGEKA
jgi:hypothetical protein